MQILIGEAQGCFGTTWVAPGKGSTWRELFDAFGHPPMRCQGYARQLFGYPHTRTNLLLTGAPLTQTDRERWESGNVK